MNGIENRRPKPKQRHYRHSYAQEGEDLILAEIFGPKRNGFFVDVGAHHPRRFSNTYHFYKFRGWRGINIDAMPGGMRAFDRVRPDDINIEAAVSDVSVTLPFFVFNETALNTFDPALAAERDGFGDYRLERTVDLKTVTLQSLLDRHLPADRTIDLMSIDVEGLDLQVLRSNDWDRHRPGVVLVEDGSVSTWSGVAGSATGTFLRDRGYQPVAKTLRTVFFGKVSGGVNTRVR
jgi:FkbM family methyltransferase